MKQVVLKIEDFIEALQNTQEIEIKNGKLNGRNIFDTIGCDKNVECKCVIPTEHYEGIMSAVLEGYKEQAEYVLLFISEDNEIEEIYTMDFLSLVLYKKSYWRL